MRLLLASLLGVTVASCAAERTDDPPRQPPPRPAAGTEVPPGATLQQAIDASPDHAVLLLQPGDYHGPFVITRPLHVWGPSEAVLHATDGTTLRVKADDVTLAGFTVAGSGQRFDLMDGGVHLQGNDLTLEGVTVRETLFGVLVERCARAVIRGNTVIGTGLSAMGLRGDGIRLWETNDSLVVGNLVRDSRDMVVWYSSRNRLTDNTVLRSRYGTHFMYSHNNTCEDGRYIGCEVGVFVMYSHDIVLRRNLIAKAVGAAGIGIGLKESGDITVEHNWLLDNTTGIYADSSPLDPDDHNRYLRNVIRFSESAVSLHSTMKRSEFADNHFGDNGAIIKVGGQGDARQCSFVGNFYDTYQGYDLDGDGRGDVPFEFRRLSTQLESRYPDLALLHGAPAMLMVDLVGEVMPLFAPRCLMQDAAPRLRPLAMTWTPGEPHAR